MGFFDDLLSSENYSSERRRNLISATLPRVFAENMSVNEAFNAYKDAGLGIRKSDFTKLYYEEAPRLIQASRISGLSDDREITNSLLAESNYVLGANYRYVAEIVIIDPVTDEVYTDTFGLDTDFIGTKQDIKDAIYEAYSQRYAEKAPYLTDVIVERAYYSK